MTIRTPTEMQMARVALGLSREELARLCGTTAAEIKNREHLYGRGMPADLIRTLEYLAKAQTQLAARLFNSKAVVTFWTDAHLDEHGLPHDMTAPTASFHRTAAALAHSHAPDGCILLAYDHRLYSTSGFCNPDKYSNRIAWACSWASLYTVEA
jgi:transcriptional regulator with XRE-family HTH domain